MDVRVLYRIPGELGECFAEFVDPLSLHLEMTLLCHARVPATLHSRTSTFASRDDAQTRSKQSAACRRGRSMRLSRNDNSLARAMPCIQRNIFRTTSESVSFKSHANQLLTKGTLARFQKITIKPHLKNWSEVRCNEIDGILFMVHIPCLRNTPFTLRAELMSVESHRCKEMAYQAFI